MNICTVDLYNHIFIHTAAYIHTSKHASIHPCILRKITRVRIMLLQYTVCAIQEVRPSVFCFFFLPQTMEPKFRRRGDGRACLFDSEDAKKVRAE